MTQKCAFTMVELLVVIAVISVLAAMLMPALSDALEGGRRIACANNQKQLYLGLTQYADDARGALPLRWFFYGGQSSLPDKLLSTRNSIETGNWNYTDYAQFTWARDYCGASMTAFNGASTTFANPTTRGIFQCPSGKMLTGQSVSYRMCYAPGINQDIVGRHLQEQIFTAKLHVAAQPKSGFRKAFFFDNLWEGIGWTWWNDYLALGQYHPQYNNHVPGFDAYGGQNVCAGDGSVKWEPYAAFGMGAYGHPATKVPRNYWAPNMWTTPSSTGACLINLYDPTLNNLSGSTYYFRQIALTQPNDTYWGLVNLWR